MSATAAVQQTHAHPDGRRGPAPEPDPRLDALDLRVCLPLLSVHVGCLAVLWVGVSPTALVVCAGLYATRLFGLTAGYHRLLSHRSFETGRPLRFALAFLGASAAQLGPLWWAGYHRLHHRHADTPEDPHSARSRGLWWAHMGWLLRRRTCRVPLEQVPDLARWPELRWLERWHWLAPLSVVAALCASGLALARFAPGLGTDAPQLVVWGFFVSTVLVYHAVFGINSIGHGFGSRRFPAPDASRNNPVLGLLVLGDGWHNNHHRFPHSARQGLGPGEPDPTYWVLWALARVGWVRGLRQPAARASAVTPRQVKAKASPVRP